MSLMPAQRLETISADAKRIGRLQEGARADIVAFDPKLSRTAQPSALPLKPV
jgi:cytosine/adenosine deaminase-related metal-dependent hydrolase